MNAQVEGAEGVIECPQDRLQSCVSDEIRRRDVFSQDLSRKTLIVHDFVHDMRDITRDPLSFDGTRIAFATNEKTRPVTISNGAIYQLGSLQSATINHSVTCPGGRHFPYGVRASRFRRRESPSLFDDISRNIVGIRGEIVSGDRIRFARH